MVMMFARRSTPLITLLFLFLVGSGSATCYYPNGDTDDGHRVCDPNASEGSTCCAEGFGCMSNGLCADLRYENFQRVLRGGCSDKGFGGSCNTVCTELWPQGDEAVFYCGSAKYCCGRSTDCCTDSSVEKHDLGEPVVIATAGKTVPKATTSAKQVSKPETTPAPQQPQEEEKKEQTEETKQTETEEKKQEESKPQATASVKKQDEEKDDKPTTSTNKEQKEKDTNSRTEVQASSTADENAPTTLATSTGLPEGVQVSNKQGTETVTVSTLTTANPANEPDNKGSSNTVAIAVGVGVGVGVVLFLILAAGCWFMRARRKREKQNNQVSELMDQHYENGGRHPFSGATGTRPLAAVNGSWWRGSRQVHEMDGHRGIELADNTEPKEIGGVERGRRESQIYMMSGDEKHLGPASKELDSDKPEKDKDNKT